MYPLKNATYVPQLISWITKSHDLFFKTKLEKPILSSHDIVELRWDYKPQDPEFISMCSFRSRIKILLLSFMEKYLVVNYQIACQIQMPYTVTSFC